MLPKLILLILLCATIEAKPVIHFGRCVSSISETAYCVEAADCEYLQQDVSRNNTAVPECGMSADQMLICCPKLSSNDTSALDAAIEVILRTGFDTPLLPEPPYCGLMLSNRIYGGSTTMIDEFPWAALLEYSTPEGRGFYCGGTLISERWVLTAAHCITGRGLRRGWRVVSVRLGEFNLDTDPDCITEWGAEDCAAPHIDVVVDRQLVHPLFNSFRVNVPNDIALLRLARAIRPTHFIKPVCLPRQESMRTLNFVGTKAEVTGWGRTENNNTASKIKLKAVLDVWNNDACQAKYHSYGFELLENHLCAGGVVGVDACQGDSGGPLALEWPSDKGKAFFQIGVVSLGKMKCGNSDTPGVYTRVGPYIDWIETTIAENS